MLLTSTVNDTSNLKATQMSTNSRMGKQSMVEIENRLLYSNENATSSSHTDESQSVEWKKQAQRIHKV